MFEGFEKGVAFEKFLRTIIAIRGSLPADFHETALDVADVITPEASAVQSVKLGRNGSPCSVEDVVRKIIESTPGASALALQPCVDHFLRIIPETIATIQDLGYHFEHRLHGPEGAQRVLIETKRQ